MNHFQCFKNKKILVTGHTGFKGSWLTAWLLLLGAKVSGISLPYEDKNSHHRLINSEKKIDDQRLDIRNIDAFKKKILEIKPDFIFHLAAQALVKDSYENPLDTWTTNCLGTVNLLDSALNLKNDCVIILITSDKCYQNNEWIWGYREDDRLGGSDPYSASKAAAEIAINSYFKSFFIESRKDNSIKIASVRAGNVIGGGDWSSNRIIPDCVKAWSKNETVLLRNPNSTRPWQHVLEPLSGYLLLASNLYRNNNLNGESFNFGPSADENYSVMELVIEMGKYWPDIKWEKVLNENQDKFESNLLKLNCDKALNKLKWKSSLSFSQTIKMTSVWYKSFFTDGTNIESVTYDQIIKFIDIAKDKGIEWAL